MYLDVGKVVIGIKTKQETYINYTHTQTFDDILC